VQDYSGPPHPHPLSRVGARGADNEHWVSLHYSGARASCPLFVTHEPTPNPSDGGELKKSPFEEGQPQGEVLRRLHGDAVVGETPRTVPLTRS